MDRRSAILCSFASLSLFSGNVVAEDLKLTDGTVFRGIHVVEVRPDSLIVAHKDGVAMADFTKLPKAIRTRYGYDPGKASAFRERDVAERQAVAEENRRLIAAHEERKQALAQKQIVAIGADHPAVAGMRASQLTYQQSESDRAYDRAVAHIGAEIAQAEEARVAARRPETFWTAPFWSHPAVKLLGLILGGGGGGGEGSSFNSTPRNWR